MNKKKQTLKCKKINEKKKGNVRTVKTNRDFNFRIIPNGKCTLKNMKNIYNKLKFLKNSRYSIKTYHQDNLEKNQYIEIILFDDCNVPCFLQISLQKTYEDKKNVLLVNIFNNVTQPKAWAYENREEGHQDCESAFSTCLNKEKNEKRSTSLDNDIINKCRTQINKYCKTPNLITTKTNISRKRFSHPLPVVSSGLYLDGNTIKKSVLLNTHQKKIVNIILNKIVKNKKASKSGTINFENNYNFYYNESHGITGEYSDSEYQKTLLNFSKFFKLFEEYPADLYSAINSDNLVDDYGNDMASRKEINNWKNNELLPPSGKKDKEGNPIPDTTILEIEKFITKLEEIVRLPPKEEPPPLSPPKPFTRKSRSAPKKEPPPRSRPKPFTRKSRLPPKEEPLPLSPPKPITRKSRPPPNST